MKIGDYVRTEYGIAKYISDIVTKYVMYYVVDKDIMVCNVEGWENCLSGSNEIIKSSPSIIDLIEVGDYVNGNKVLDKEDYLLWVFDNEKQDTLYYNEKDIFPLKKYKY